MNSIDWCSTLKLDSKLPAFKPGENFLGSANAFGDHDARKVGWVTAVDADTGAVRWRFQTSTPMVAGLLATASGLVFTADLQGDLLAFDAESGRVLHRIPTRQPAGGGVIAYQAGGKERIGVAAGMENRILATRGQPVVLVFGL